MLKLGFDSLGSHELEKAAGLRNVLLRETDASCSLLVGCHACSNQGGIASQLDGKQSVKLRERAEQAFEKV